MSPQTGSFRLPGSQGEPPVEVEPVELVEVEPVELKSDVDTGSVVEVELVVALEVGALVSFGSVSVQLGDPSATVVDERVVDGRSGNVGL
ncbi:hypothetical protein [Nannocystis pusilla]|uniref:Uncharacterized protein n=1 Tax=Nannocystis pusilla TaxID=889268 RepID=A0ABS7U5X9_9BACT|nr:hypothetical protein [Nannocystis pusilla]MBZ5715796.1 hypothetical protein [Nannocystis pusilla]